MDNDAAMGAYRAMIWNDAKEWSRSLNLSLGTLVEATQDYDPEGAKVKKGDEGFVFGETNCYGDGAGPIVRWFSGGTCNVYPEMCEAIWLL